MSNKNETTEEWREIRKDKQDKKWNKAHECLEKLEKLNISFEVVNFSTCHTLIKKQQIDYYPTTGLWKRRNEKKWHKGIDSLLRNIESEI